MSQAALPLLLVLAAAVALYLALAWGLRRLAAAHGLQAGRIIAADDAGLGSPTLRSEQLGLVGRPDHVVRIGGRYVPVEQKPGAPRLHASHALQVGALCLLIAETYRSRPPHGIVVLARGRRHRVDFDRALEERVLRTVSEQRRVLAHGQAPPPRWVPGKCTHCGYRSRCWRADSVPR